MLGTSSQFFILSAHIYARPISLFSVLVIGEEGLNFCIVVSRQLFCISVDVLIKENFDWIHDFL